MKVSAAGEWRGGRGLRAWAVTVFAGMTCAACSGSLFESDTPVSTSYVLASAPRAAGPASGTQADLSIGRPELAAGLDTERIAVLTGQQLDYFRGARWGSRAPEVIQMLLVDSLEDQQLFRSVTAEQARVASDYVLDVTVRDFQAEYTRQTEAPTAHVAMVGRIIRVADRQLVRTLVAAAQSRAVDNRMSAVVAAFEHAAHQVALDLAQQTAAAIAGDEQHLRTAHDDDGRR